MSEAESKAEASTSPTSPTSPTLAPEQSRAADAFFQWLADWEHGTPHRPWFSIQGPGGVGKTFLATKIAQRFRETRKGNVYGMAYTGRAALMLTRKGLPSTTIHGRIYLPLTERTEEVDKLNQELRADPPPKPARIAQIRARLEVLHEPKFLLRENPAYDKSGELQYVFSPNSLIICDELSMVGREEGEDLLSFNRPILVLGDPYQLPPIEGKGYFDKNPDVILTEIHRQAAENPIIKLATMARNGKRPPLGKYGDSLITSRKNITTAMLCEADIVLCGSNKARVELNERIRKAKGFTSPFPQAKERLICLRNNPKEGVLNGQLFETIADSREINDFTVEIFLESGPLRVHKACFENPEELKSWAYSRRRMANEVTWGWAITGHKSQGGEWPNVLVWADMWQWDAIKSSQWNYTALSRASEKVIFAF